MDDPNSAVPVADVGIAWTEADGLLLQRDSLLCRSGKELAPAERGECEHPVAIGRDHGLEFGNGLLASRHRVDAARRVRELRAGELRERIPPSRHTAKLTAAFAG